MHPRARIPLLLGLSLLGRPLAARAEVLTLAQAEDLAVAHDAAVAAGTARADGADAHERTVAASTRPILTAEASASVAPGTPLVHVLDASGGQILVVGSRTLRSQDAFDPFVRYAAVLRLDAIQYDFGRSAARVRDARAQADALDADADALREAARSAVRGAYLLWLAAHAERQLVDRALESAEARARAVSGSADVGTRPGSDRDVAGIDVASLRLRRSRALGAEDEARWGLAARIGRPVSEEDEPDVAMLTREGAHGRDGQAAALRALSQRREAALATLEWRRRRHAPVLAGTLRLGVNGQNDVVFPTYQGQLVFSVPLWDPRTGDSVRDEALARLAELEAEERALRERAAFEQARAQAASDRAEEQVRLASEMRELALRAERGAEDRYREGAASLEHVLGARDRVIDAERELLRAELDRLAAALAAPTR